MRHLLSYLRLYNEPDHREVNRLALESWREYISTRSRIYDMDVCRRYQHAFEASYRDAHAKRQLALAKES